MSSRAYYKIIIDEQASGPCVLAFIFPRNPKAKPEKQTVDDYLEGFLVSVDEIQDGTGFDFLWSLSDVVESAIEGTRAIALWP
ncbi:MAG: hypothetical protein NTX23_05310 [Candidatus Bipolaricaulota bacterium]|nr:hypothetical protein [Candidatus Bipolaricaulota bacterium]